MTYFTPGPWRLTSDAGHPTNARITSTARRHIAKVYADNAGPDPTCEANARLIAAAPKLYEALAAIVEELEDGDVTSAEQIARHAGKEALAEARGEQP